MPTECGVCSNVSIIELSRKLATCEFKIGGLKHETEHTKQLFEWEERT